LGRREGGGAAPAAVEVGEAGRQRGDRRTRRDLFSGGGFRLWDDIVCKQEVLPLFRGVVLVGCGKQSFDLPEKPSRAPAVLFVGDPKDPNYGEHGPAGAKILKRLGYEVKVFEHKSGHSVPRKQTKAVYAWIAKTIKKHRRRG